MSLPPVQPPLSTALASDSFQLLPEAEKAGAAEDALYESQVKGVEAWWSTPRFAGIKRPYTAADVVSKRGSQMQSYPSSVMARKLFNLIKEREAAGEPIHTSTGCYRSRPNDTTSATPRSPLPLRLGLLERPNNYERGLPRFWRLSLQYGAQPGAAHGQSAIDARPQAMGLTT
ncbi:hypothetical protein O1611_g8543 [Lasiodiplodia mahajangana]|uniref:Uncharacterized protein n=1 Tax=Lasiodiplodia mahajangana TaxID=1108764 RepID=A0ACC2JCU1_9PEZI|nr:hypothetical protein O1611_g8543 [Lasiodiplodia mahajangana]